jgi:hypothetical protein
MKVYNAEGKSMNADKDQMEILFDSGWTTTKPEPVKEESESVESTTAKPKLVKRSVKKISK